jgi:hypothetical protein
MDFHQNIRNEGLGGYQCTTWGSGKIIDVRQVEMNQAMSISMDYEVIHISTMC